MKKLDKKSQISYRSTPEIVSRLDLAASKLAVARIAFAREKLRTGHLVNAIALWVGRLGDDELAKFATPLLRDLEVFLERDDPADAPSDPVVKGRSGVLRPTTQSGKPGNRIGSGRPKSDG